MESEYLSVVSMFTLFSVSESGAFDHGQQSSSEFHETPE